MKPTSNSNGIKLRCKFFKEAWSVLKYEWSICMCMRMSVGKAESEGIFPVP